MYHLTTDHPASSYGIPVLVDDDGHTYGPADILPNGQSAADWVGDNLTESDDWRRFLAPLVPRGRPRLYQAPRVTITLRLDADQVREIDELRGPVSRTAWIAAALGTVLSRTSID